MRLPISETRLPIGKARVPDGGEGATANEAVNPADGARAPSSEAGTPRCGVIAASSRIEDYTEDGRTISFTVRGPRPLQAVARVRCKVKPAAVTMQAGAAEIKRRRKPASGFPSIGIRRPKRSWCVMSTAKRKHALQSIKVSDQKRPF